MVPAEQAEHFVRSPRCYHETPGFSHGEKSFQDLQGLADQRQVTVLELLRKFIRLGLLVAKAEDSPDAVFVIREGDKERELVLL